jgi:hypothetical protein
MIDAAEVAGLAFAQAADLGAAMRADIQEATDPTFAISQKNDPAPTDGPRNELIRIGQLGVMPHIQPALGKDLCHFLLEDSGVGIV